MIDISALTRVITFSFVFFCTLKDVLLALLSIRRSAVGSSSFHATANWILALGVYEKGGLFFVSRIGNVGTGVGWMSVIPCRLLLLLGHTLPIHTLLE
jgi:hypothetical protein